MARPPWTDRPVQPIVANPGGTVSPDEVVGRDDQIGEICESTIGHGAYVVGDRRMGKTSTLGPVERVLEQGPNVVLRVGGETTNPAVLEARLADQLQHHARFRNELQNWDLAVDISKGPIKLSRTGKKGVATQDDLFEWAAKACGSDRLVLVLDEVTEAAKAFADSPGGAAGLLHQLRHVRDNVPNVAMIFSGSVGLHHVVGDMLTVNDLRTVKVGALSYDDACYLARCLIQGTLEPRHATVDELSLCEVLAEASDGTPYYLHHLVLALRSDRREHSAEVVEDLVASAIATPDDPWHLRHYLDRIDGYYGEDAGMIKAILDQYAVEGALGICALRRHLAAQGIALDHDAAATLVGRLERDYYLTPFDEEGTTIDVFTSNLVRRAWRRHRRI